MSVINILDKETIDKIAAGEVVERPSSVVKELLENAIDANSTAVTIEIKDGGISFIRITDNGKGIEKDDIRTAFVAHATSKIHSAEDLLSISSLGFRGEALSSICAVSMVECISKTRSDLTGVRYCIEGGVEKSLEDIGAPVGTTFIVRNLFFNTPARKKFLKTATTEGSYISTLVERMALSHPEISIRYICNGQTKLHTSGNGKLKDIIYSIFGREISSNLVEINDEAMGMSINGYIGKPMITRGNRNNMIYFINGRYIKSKIIYSAIEEAFKPFIMPHTYPFSVLHFTIASEFIDVNIHPSKMELRFTNQRDVYNFFCGILRNSLENVNIIPNVKPDFDPDKMIQDKANQGNVNQGSTNQGKVNQGNANQSGIIQGIVSQNSINSDKLNPDTSSSTLNLKYEISTKDNISNTNLVKESAENQYKSNNNSIDADESEEEKKEEKKEISAEPFEKEKLSQSINILSENISNELEKDNVREPEIPARVEVNTDEIDDSTVVSSNNVIIKDVDDSFASGNVLKEAKPQQLTFFDNKFFSEKSRVKHKMIGQLFDTYWLIEYDNNLYIIDQHAAHEKVLYEKTMKEFREKKFLSQQLNPPIVLTLTLAEADMLEKFMDNFTELGYEIEAFGGHEYAVRAVPYNFYSISTKELLMDLIQNLNEDSVTLNSEMITDRIATISCKAAIKGNNRISLEEANELITRLLELENPYNCPHGRPTIISMSKYEIEKKFKRII